MAQMLLHGVIDAKILEADLQSVTSDGQLRPARKSVMKRKVFSWIKKLPFCNNCMPDPDTDYMKAQEARRFMIYVHAKTMIVDDEYIIVGSANINQRSMDGGRDTEITMGAYQPNYLASRNRPARGQVHGLRLALWKEHLGVDVEGAMGDLLQPSNMACMRRINQVAQQHWETFASDTPLAQRDLPGHLMAYPIGVTEGGKLLETTQHFPDTKAGVFGNKSPYLPPILTT